MEEWQGKKGGKKDKKEKSRGTCVEEKIRGKKKKRKKKRRTEMPCVEDKKRVEKKGKKKKEMLSQYFHNSFTINFKG